MLGFFIGVVRGDQSDTPQQSPEEGGGTSCLPQAVPTYASCSGVIICKAPSMAYRCLAEERTQLTASEKALRQE